MNNQYYEYTLNSISNTEDSRVVGSSENNSFFFSSSDNVKPNDVYTLARSFLCISSMTHKKLQKLCYYAKAWYLAIYDKNIIEEGFEAWVHGAVQPDLYQKYRVYGFSDIPRETDKSTIPEEFLCFAKEIYASYGHLTGDELEKINHSEYPWIEARGNCRPWENCKNKISEDTMKKFYRERLQ